MIWALAIATVLVFAILVMGYSAGMEVERRRQDVLYRAKLLRIAGELEAIRVEMAVGLKELEALDTADFHERLHREIWAGDAETT